jgi:hypothetical protein
MKKILKICAYSLAFLAGSVILLALLSFVLNRQLPQASPVIETLSDHEKIRLAETRHLIEELGDRVWPGWAQADLPAIRYNEDYAFLVGYPDPPDGWVKVPAGIRRGGAWERVTGDTFDGEIYYRQALPDPETTPEAFAVRVGDRWASSLQTMDWAIISLTQTIREDLPGFMRPVFPYRLFLRQAISGSEAYISLAAHETFHAFQGQAAPQKFAAAERANTTQADRYPWEDPAFQADWQRELDLLAAVLGANGHEESARLAREFLEQRQARRQAAGLADELIRYEQQREWLEGLARYAELEIWRQADSEDYLPLLVTELLPDFDSYAGFEHRWNREIDQITRMAGDHGDGRFYFSGFAQAVLLDCLLPEWKTRAFENSVWLDELLAEAISEDES